MRLPRFRFTVRQMIVAVAVAAVGLGIRAQLARWRQLARFYEITAARIDRSVVCLRPYADMSDEQWVMDRRAVDEVNRKGGTTWEMKAYGPEPNFARRMAVHWDMVAKKYHRAATQPWWPVKPDPPPPKP